MEVILESLNDFIEKKEKYEFKNREKTFEAKAERNDEFFNSKVLKIRYGSYGKVFITKDYVMKISKDNNFDNEHEYKVSEQITYMKNYVPHFVGTYGLFDFPINIKNKKYYTKVLIQEKIEGHLAIDKIPEMNDNEIYSFISQTLLTFIIGQIKKKFTHYDSSCRNIMIKKCRNNDIFLYKLNSEYYLIPSFGICSVLIDYGYSHIDMKCNNLFSLVGCYDCGMIPIVFDKYADFHLFLIPLMSFLKPRNDIFEKLSSEIETIFKSDIVDLKTGFKKFDDDIYTELRFNIKKSNDFFDTNFIDIIQILNSLILLPLKEYKETNFNESWSFFFEEFNKIIDKKKFDKKTKLYLLKCLIISYRENEDFSYYFSKEIGKYDEIKFKESVIKISEYLSTFYCKYLQKYLPIIKKYNEDIKKEPIDIYNMIRENINYKFTKSNLYLFNCDDETMKLYKNIDLSSLNQTKDKVKKILKILNL